MNYGIIPRSVQHPSVDHSNRRCKCRCHQESVWYFTWFCITGCRRVSATELHIPITRIVAAPDATLDQPETPNCRTTPEQRTRLHSHARSPPSNSLNTYRTLGRAWLRRWWGTSLQLNLLPQRFVQPLCAELESRICSQPEELAPSIPNCATRRG